MTTPTPEWLEANRRAMERLQKEAHRRSGNSYDAGYYQGLCAGYRMAEAISQEQYTQLTAPRVKETA